MNDGFTIYNQNSTYDYPSLDDTENAVDYLKAPDSFRSFDKGLTELLVKAGYSGKTDNIEELSEYLISKLRKINSCIGKETIVSWFSGKHRPKVEAGSRKKIYEICFALELSYKDTLWFFHHVYYDRAFNYHTISESVYYYAFLNHLTYQEAQTIIQEIETTPTLSADTKISGNYTQFVKNRIEELNSISELKAFLIQNSGNYNAWNKTAFDELRKLKSILIGPLESIDTVNRLKRTIQQKQDINRNPNGNISVRSLDLFSLVDYQNCGLLIKELLFESKTITTGESPAEYFLDITKDRNIRTNDFVLERILSISNGMQKMKDIPYIVRNNFPSKKTMSDILSEDKISTSKSYDSIRKMIILLDFYRFWASNKYENTYTDIPSDDLSLVYKDEINSLLYQCGYEELYAGNPYDWIFLCSAQSEDPLEYFRACIEEILSGS